MAQPRTTRPRALIRVGQRLINWDGQRGYVDTNSRGIRVYGPGDSFQICWLDADGEVEDSTMATLDTLAVEGITWGRGVMAWAR